MGLETKQNSTTALYPNSSVIALTTLRSMAQIADGVKWRASTVPLGLLGGVVKSLWVGTRILAEELVMKIWRFLTEAWDLGANDPKKVIHCLKVGMALTLVSLFYYIRPLYDGVGGNAMWAVMTVVVVFESTVGATLCKSLNRVCGTFLAGFLAVGVQWIASRLGEEYEPIIIGVALFFLASAVTFSRFIPTVKARFDYGAMIFILTFSLVSVSGYRVDELVALAHHRLSTIIIGTSLCILTSMLVCPIWAGGQLYILITSNMDKLADSLDGCVSEYIESNADAAESTKTNSAKRLLGYKCVLSSKASEDSMANFARWEPAHGMFNFQHPWTQYLKIGASMRSCASCIVALKSCAESENQAPDYMKQHIRDTCLKVSSNCSSVIKELTLVTKNMTKSSRLDLLIEEMRNGVKDVQRNLNDLPNRLLPTEEPIDEAISLQVVDRIPLMDVMPLVTFASLLIEMAVRIEGVAGAVGELAILADYKAAAADDEFKVVESVSINVVDVDTDKVHMNINMKSLQRV